MIIVLSTINPSVIGVICPDLANVLGRRRGPFGDRPSPGPGHYEARNGFEATASGDQAGQ